MSVASTFTAVAVKVVPPGPESVKAPVCVIGPAAVTSKFPLPRVEAARIRPPAPESRIATSLAPELLRLTAPIKLLPASVSVIAFAPALKLEVPVIVIGTFCVILPTAVAVRMPPTELAPIVKASAAPVVTPRLPLIVEVMMSSAPVSFRVTLLPEFTCTTLKLLAPPSVMLLPAPAVMCRTPGTVSAPLWVIARPVMRSRPAPTEEAPRISALASVTATLKAPELFRLTAPVKSLAAVVSVMTPAPPLKLEVPPTVSPPAVWVMPTAFTVRLLAVLIVPSWIALVSVS